MLLCTLIDTSNIGSEILPITWVCPHIKDNTSACFITDICGRFDEAAQKAAPPNLLNFFIITDLVELPERKMEATKSQLEVKERHGDGLTT